MLLGWVLVATLEWVAWRGRPHYGSGLPPRYYVPRLSLPPALPVQASRSSGFPTAARAEEPAWIASPAMRTEVLGEWPLAVPGAVAPRAEPPEADPWLVASLPVAPIERDAPPKREPVSASGPPAAEVVERGEVVVVAWSTVIAARDRQGPRAIHSLDPFAEQPKRRRGGGDEEPLRVDVPARPPGVRPLPSRWEETRRG